MSNIYRLPSIFVGICAGGLALAQCSAPAHNEPKTQKEVFCEYATMANAEFDKEGRTTVAGMVITKKEDLKTVTEDILLRKPDGTPIDCTGEHPAP